MCLKGYLLTVVLLFDCEADGHGCCHCKENYLEGAGATYHRSTNSSLPEHQNCSVQTASTSYFFNHYSHRTFQEFTPLGMLYLTVLMAD